MESTTAGRRMLLTQTADAEKERGGEEQTKKIHRTEAGMLVMLQPAAGGCCRWSSPMTICCA